jgi:hypothetical protein
MNQDDDQINEEFLSFSPSIIPWHQIISLYINQPFSSTHLHRLLPKLTNLRILELYYRSKDDVKLNLKDEILINVLDDASLCNILMLNGLQELILHIDTVEAFKMLPLAYLIVQRLPYLQVIELDGNDNQLIEMSHIFINNLSKLTFLTLFGCQKHAQLYNRKLHDLHNSNTRRFRTEVPNSTDEDMLFVWLE